MVRVSLRDRALGVRQILLRCALGNGSAGGALGICQSLLIANSFCLMQDRQHILDHELWYKNLNTVVQRFGLGSRLPDRARHQSIEMGRIQLRRALAFASVAEDLRVDYPEIHLVGPCVLDFEPIPFIRSLLNGCKIHWDVVGYALCRSPRLPETGVLVSIQKIYHFVACVLCSNRANHRFWITEVNWPLQNQSPYAPTGEKECVSEDDAGTYLKRYYRRLESGLVERVLVAACIQGIRAY